MQPTDASACYRIYDPSALSARSRLSSPRRSPSCAPPAPRPRLVAVAPAAAPAAARQPRRDALPSDLENEMMEILVRPPQGETIEAAYRAKEDDLRQRFAGLTRAEARVLHRRLLDPRADDELAARFARLNEERRRRLLASLVTTGDRR